MRRRPLSRSPRRAISRSPLRRRVSPDERGLTDRWEMGEQVAADIDNERWEMQ